MLENHGMTSTLSEQLVNLVNEYTTESIKAVDDLTSRTAENVRREIMTASPRRTGKYRRGWIVTKERFYFTSTATIHNKNYRLPHLLEGQHLIKSHGKSTYQYTMPHRHIKPVEEKYVEEYKRELEEIFKNA